MAEWARETPWRQGHLLNSDAIGALGFHHSGLQDRILVVIATHDCDLAQLPELFTPNKAWKHIELRSCEPISESVLSYLEFKQLKRWRLEHISLAADPQQPPLAE